MGNMVECGVKVGVKLVRAKSGLGFLWDRLGRQGSHTCALTHLFQLLNSPLLYFHLAMITRVIQKLCFCVLTDLDTGEEDRRVERKTD